MSEGKCDDGDKEGSEGSGDVAGTITVGLFEAVRWY